MALSRLVPSIKMSCKSNLTAPDSHFHTILLRITKSQNVASEKVGVLNRFTQYIVRYKYFLQGLKKRNRAGYYGVKWALIAGLVVLVFGRGLFDIMLA